MSAEKDTAVCQGNGGSVVYHDGYGIIGGEWIEEPCNRCGQWHSSPDEREQERRHQEWVANPGVIRRAWRRVTGRPLPPASSERGDVR